MSPQIRERRTKPAPPSRAPRTLFLFLPSASNDRFAEAAVRSAIVRFPVDGFATVFRLQSGLGASNVVFAVADASFADTAQRAKFRARLLRDFLNAVGRG